MPPTTTEYEANIHPDFLPTAALWAAVEPLLPAAHRLGRPRVCDRQMFFAIF